MTLHERAQRLFERWEATDPAFQALLLEEEGWTAEEIEAETGVAVSICYYRVGGDHCFCIADPLLESCCNLRYGHRCPAHLGSSWAWRAAVGWINDLDRLRAEVMALTAPEVEVVDFPAFCVAMDAFCRAAFNGEMGLRAMGWCPRGMGRYSVPEIEGWE